MLEKIIQILGKWGDVVGNGKRDEFLWFDIDREEPLDKEEQEKIEAALREGGVITVVLNAGVALNRELGRNVQRLWLVVFENETQKEEW